MGQVAKDTHQIGGVSVARVIEQSAPTFAPDFLFPDGDASVLDEHGDWMIPERYNAAEAKFIISIHTWVVRTTRQTILIDSCAGNHKHRPLFPPFDQLHLPFLDRLQDAGVAPTPWPCMPW